VGPVSLGVTNGSKTNVLGVARKAKGAVAKGKKEESTLSVVEGRRGIIWI